MTDSAHDFGYDSAHDPDAAPDGLTTPQLAAFVATQSRISPCFVSPLP